MGSELAWMTYQEMGEKVQNNLHLNRVLLAIPSKLRPQFYAAIRPFLKFEPNPSFAALPRK